MSFELVVTTRKAPGEKDVGRKDVGEDILLSGLSGEYKVYAFYFPGQGMRDLEFEGQLRGLGKQTGKNLLVNICTLGNQEFDRISRLFDLKKYPVIVMTAVEALAASGEDNLTAYARLDSENLLNAPDRALRCAQDLFTLFLQGKVAEAVSHAKWAQRAEVLRAVAGVVGTALSRVAGLVFDRDIVIEFLEVKLELKKTAS